MSSSRTSHRLLSLLPLHAVKDQSLLSLSPTANSASPDPAPRRSALSRRKSAAVALDTNAAPQRSVGGGGERNRTVDLLLAKQALSQLSYTPRTLGVAQSPKRRQGPGLDPGRERRRPQATPNSWLEPSLAPSRSRCARAQLTRPRHFASQKPVVGQGGFEPPTSRLSSARSNQLSY